MKKVLFLLKKQNIYGYSHHPVARSGLRNSVFKLSEALQSIGYNTHTAICIDGNQIDKEVFNYKPDVCIIEALWATPDKLREIVKLHKKVLFVVRIHSNFPFLALEGKAIEWLKEYEKIKNVLISFNNGETNVYAHSIFKFPVYLPNIYFPDEHDKIVIKHKHYIDVGCFGAIRPFKNTFIQAIAAIMLGEHYNLPVHFHVNSGRIEQFGENVLKNLHALFRDNHHVLVSHPWMSHDKFMEVVTQMDICMQVSYTESFNIVAADAVAGNVPIIVSKDISWMPERLIIDNPNDAIEMRSKMIKVLKTPDRYTRLARRALINYNEDALEKWVKFLK